ncbi:ATP-dependent DNA ligase [Candidatus Woesearchaeota archaeon]|nr:ATP-dependent DNA ligase [Candidatus Woesearchaeota archaeon]
MLYQSLVDVYVRLAGTSKRLEKTNVLSGFLSQVSEDDAERVILLLQGLVFPVWDERRLGVAEKLVLRAISKATGKSAEAVEQVWKTSGDLGDAAAACVQAKTQAVLYSGELSVGKVFANLQQVASFTGDGTVDNKVGLIAELLTSATPVQARYVIRTALGDLRIGLGDGTMRDATVWSCFAARLGLTYDASENDFQLTPEQRQQYDRVVDAVQFAYDRTTDFASVLSAARKGEDSLRSMKIVVGKPLKVMLYQKASTIGEAFEVVDRPASVEYKYDGFRLQIHKKREEVFLFTRRLENVTAQFPDVADRARSCISAREAIVEAEIVGFDLATGKYLPFQNISVRIQRKYDIQETAAKYPVHIVLFDLIVVEGRDCTLLPYKDRIELLTHAVAQSREFHLAERITTDDEQEATQFYVKSLSVGNEGVMLKRLDSPYQPGSRVGFGVKVKAVMDAVDVVIVGAEWGEGKRSAWLSSFEIACRHGDQFLTIGRVGTGFKEKAEEGTTFADLTEALKPHVRAQKGREVAVAPAVVIEVAYEEIQASPSYSAEFALRFPRFIRLRPDRRPEDVTTLDDIRELYSHQRGK